MDISSFIKKRLALMEEKGAITFDQALCNSDSSSNSKERENDNWKKSDYKKNAKKRKILASYLKWFKEDESSDKSDTSNELNNILAELNKSSKDDEEPAANLGQSDLQSPLTTSSNVKFIDPVENLINKRFKITSSSAPTGSIMELKMVKQYPYQRETGKPLFELEEMSEKYELMEKSMATLYGSIPFDFSLDMSDLREGGYYALIETECEEEEEEEETENYKKTVNVKRIKIHHLSRSNRLCSLEYIDYCFKTVIGWNSSTILHLDKSFATLPPRVCSIEMEGLSHYKDVEVVRRFIRYDSDNYLFDGLLTAEVQPSGKVVVWSEQFPQKLYPYGINGFITKSVVDAYGNVPALPRVGEYLRDAFVVYADDAGNISLQFNSFISRHFMEIFQSIDNEKIKSLRGSVVSPQKHIIYMAPYAPSEGTYYRAIVCSAPKDGLLPEDEIEVLYIDYGNMAKVKIEDLVKAEDVHYALGVMPQMYIEAHLENIWSVNREEYFKAYHASDQTYEVLVVKEAEDPEKDKYPLAADVILRKRDQKSGEYWYLNQKIAENGYADAIDPFFNYKEVADYRMGAINWMNKPLQYLGLGSGRRLHEGDELDVRIKYDRRMPGCKFFMVPKHRVSSFRILDAHLLKVLDRLTDESGIKARMLSKAERIVGDCVLFHSRRVKRLVRGVLIKEKVVEDQLEVSLVEMNETESNEDQKTTMKKISYMRSIWTVYLMDFGMLEKVHSIGLFRPDPQSLDFPAFGILAEHSDLNNINKIRKWWQSFPGHMPRAREENGDKIIVEKEEYDEALCINKRVKVVKVLQGKYGETAQVVWCNRRNNRKNGTPDSWMSDLDGVDAEDETSSSQENDTNRKTTEIKLNTGFVDCLSTIRNSFGFEFEAKQVVEVTNAKPTFTRSRRPCRKKVMKEKEKSVKENRTKSAPSNIHNEKLVQIVPNKISNFSEGINGQKEVKKPCVVNETGDNVVKSTTETEKKVCTLQGVDRSEGILTQSRVKICPSDTENESDMSSY